eukprot:snap_masked-scaffold_124-processed-gene-0.11-mRNA-1 protein AED:1.00 eAED:1.00 QI:0/-1/0/0/-1/1/1/0/521
MDFVGYIGQSQYTLEKSTISKAKIDFQKHPYLTKKAKLDMEAIIKRSEKKMDIIPKEARDQINHKLRGLSPYLIPFIADDFESEMKCYEKNRQELNMKFGSHLFMIKRKTYKNASSFNYDVPKSRWFEDIKRARNSGNVYHEFSYTEDAIDLYDLERMRLFSAFQHVINATLFSVKKQYDVTICLKEIKNPSQAARRYQARFKDVYRYSKQYGRQVKYWAERSRSLGVPPYSCDDDLISFQNMLDAYLTDNPGENYYNAFNTCLGLFFERSFVWEEKTSNITYHGFFHASNQFPKRAFERISFFLAYLSLAVSLLSNDEVYDGEENLCLSSHPLGSLFSRLAFDNIMIEMLKPPLYSLGRSIRGYRMDRIDQIVTSIKRGFKRNEQIHDVKFRSDEKDVPEMVNFRDPEDLKRLHPYFRELANFTWATSVIDLGMVHAYFEDNEELPVKLKQSKNKKVEKSKIKPESVEKILKARFKTWKKFHDDLDPELMHVMISACFSESYRRFFYNQFASALMSTVAD